MNNDKAINLECYEARPATANDQQLIKEWLKAEYDEHGCGFFCNWRIIEEAFTKKRMTVLAERNGDLPVAFAILSGEVIDIFWVRPEMRDKGFGEKLDSELTSLFKRRRKAGVLLTHVLDQSVGFWRKRGYCEIPFEQSWNFSTRDNEEKNATVMLKTLNTQRRSSAGGLKPITVQIEFLYDHGDTNQFEPYGNIGTIEGIQNGDNCIKLLNNFTCLINFYKSHHTRVRIRLDGKIVIDEIPLKEFCSENKINMKNTQFFTMRSFHLGEKIPESLLTKEKSMAKVTFPTTDITPLLVDKAMMATRFRTFHNERTNLQLIQPVRDSAFPTPPCLTQFGCNGE